MNPACSGLDARRLGRVVADNSGFELVASFRPGRSSDIASAQRSSMHATGKRHAGLEARNRIRSAEQRRSSLAKVLLVALILAVTLSPRIRLGFLDQRAIDLRIQDILLLPALLLSMRFGGTTGARAFWGFWCAALCWTAAIVTLLSALADSGPPILGRIAYLGRGLEPFLLALVVCRLVVGCGGTTAALRAIQVAAVLNLSWVGYQAFSGTTGTLLGSSVGSQIDAYGPKLIGEGSAFGTGAFFAFVAALAVAQYRTGTGPRVINVAMLVAAGFAAYLSQSRIWLGAIALYVLMLVLRPEMRWKVTRTLLLAVAAACLLLLSPPRLPSAGRLSGSGVDTSFAARTDSIWLPLVERLLADPITTIAGLGPGGLLSTGITEAHNLALRSIIDYGPVGAILLIAIILRTGVVSWRVAADHDCPRARRMWAELTCLSMIGLLVSGSVQDSFTAVTSSHLAMLVVGIFAGTLMPPANRAAVETGRYVSSWPDPSPLSGGGNRRVRGNRGGSSRQYDFFELFEEKIETEPGACHGRGSRPSG